MDLLSAGCHRPESPMADADGNVGGQYGYYVTDSYPWIIGCHSGIPDPSFAKGR